MNEDPVSLRYLADRMHGRVSGEVVGHDAHGFGGGDTLRHGDGVFDGDTYVFGVSPAEAEQRTDPLPLIESRHTRPGRVDNTDNVHTWGEGRARKAREASGTHHDVEAGYSGRFYLHPDLARAGLGNGLFDVLQHGGPTPLGNDDPVVTGLRHADPSFRHHRGARSAARLEEEVMCFVR
jgi:hypothetical protein